MTDLQTLCTMFARVGWHRRIVLEGDRCFCFARGGSLSSIRNYNDTRSFDGDSV